MDFGLTDKVAMVAASSKGIGLACAQALAREGCRVSICARHEDVLEQAAESIEGECFTYVVDVCDADDLNWWVEQTRQDAGRIDILVTNTGGPPAGALDTMTDEQWQLGFDATLMNVVRLVRMVAPEMAERGWGRIVHLSSLVAKDPNMMLPISSTLRAGLQSLTRLQASQYAASGVTVNAVLPGHTMTDRQLHLAELRAQREGCTTEEALARQGAEQPIGRLARAEEIAAAVAFLCSAPASYVTGISMLVDGGATRTAG